MYKLESLIKNTYTEIHKIFKKVSKFSEYRVSIHGAYYTAFGVLGSINCTFPYFIWSFEFGENYITAGLRLISSLLCFLLILHSQVNKEVNGSKSEILPLYWHLTLLFCLPLMSTYTLFTSAFATSWLINSILMMFTLALLVDWLSFIFIFPIGSITGYLIYCFSVGKITIPYVKDNLMVAIYLNTFAFIISLFFLYQKEQMLDMLIDARSKLQTLNLNLEDKVYKRTNFLKKALNAKTEFLNNVSHEIRTPLQGINGISTELIDSWNNIKDVEKFRYTKSIANNSERLITLLTNLLDLSKFDSGKMLFNLERASLDSIIEPLFQEVSNLNIKPGLQFQLNIVKGINYIAKIDKDRISQVVRNILYNALKFTDSGHIILTLCDNKHSKWGDKEGICIKVEDSGPGIPEEEIPDIFQPFIQSSRTKTGAGGTGIGLSICAEIIHAHKGYIWAENNKNGIGATFYCVIPRNLDEVEKSETYNYKTKYSNTRVLLVDDEEPCLTSGSLILRSAGFEVYTADNGSKALDMLKNEHFEIILLDLMIPDIYGLDIIKIIKKDKILKTIPIILQTGTSDTVEIAKAFSLGIAGYISKPYNKQQMLKTIQEIYSKS